ncbi:hypothetical protein EAG_09994 [Camponotus floridanus]|uniref:Uncharacterized protein n=1 Tax=Camponotus floridanus TaxID=104421 RepID=E1ZY41_CAMFO|nr:hypothetical protein EAG_09994 [Camponotus floridanus]
MNTDQNNFIMHQQDEPWIIPELVRLTDNEVREIVNKRENTKNQLPGNSSSPLRYDEDREAKKGESSSLTTYVEKQNKLGQMGGSTMRKGGKSLPSWSAIVSLSRVTRGCSGDVRGCEGEPFIFPEVVAHRAPPRQETAAVARTLFRLRCSGGFSLLRRALYQCTLASSFQFPGGSPTAIINRNEIPVMCDGTLFRRYNVSRTRATLRSNGEFVVFGAGSGVGTDYSNMEWRLAGVAVAPGLFYRTNGFIKCQRELAADGRERAEPVS